MRHPDHIDGLAIRLRPATTADRRMIYEGLAHSDVSDVLLMDRHTGQPLPLTYETFCDDYVDYYFDDTRPEAGRCFVIEVDGRAAGQVNHNDIEPCANRTELDIWMFGERNCGHGWGTEALRLLCDYLHREMGVHGFYIKPSARNPRAIRSYEKAGFVRTALSEDAALAAYGPRDAPDTVFMTRNIEIPDPAYAASST
jgi:RimJ/RimL family protein N-acetyltransferase